MTTVHDPLDYVCGDTLTLSGVLQDAECKPLPLAGASISWHLDSLDGTHKFLAVSLSDGIQIIDWSTSAILVSIPAAATSSLPPNSYTDWLRVTLADGTTLTEWTGIIRIAPNPA